MLLQLVELCKLMGPRLGTDPTLHQLVDLIRAPYVLYGVKYIDLVALMTHRELDPTLHQLGLDRVGRVSEIRELAASN